MKTFTLHVAECAFPPVSLAAPSEPVQRLVFLTWQSWCRAELLQAG